MKVFAVVPALLVLVSLCASPVPPPPGTVSGSVFYDANRNGIRDSCDSPMQNTQVVLNGPEGLTAIARTDRVGAFEIDDAPVGDGLVTLFTGEGLVWPITTEPQTVRVESSRESGGVEIGSASKAVYDADQKSISGVIFADANGNGEVDVDECPISDSIGGFNISSGGRIAVIGPGSTYALKNLPEGHEMRVTAAYSSTVDPLGPGAIGSRPLRATNGVFANDPCTSFHMPKPRYGPLVYEANIGFKLAEGNGSVSGVVFEDADGDGVQGEGEGGLAGVTLRLLAKGGGGCVGYQSDLSVTTQKDGVYGLSGIYPGEYLVQIDANVVGNSEFVTPIEPERTVALISGDTLTVDIPVKSDPGAFLGVMAFDDADGSGLWSVDEEAVAGSVICLTPTTGGGDPSDWFYNSVDCAPTGEGGLATLGPVRPGEYFVVLGGLKPTLLISRRQPLPTSLEAGEQQVDLALDVLRIEEQVILPSAESDRQSPEICYSDASWVDPPFEEVYSDGLVFQGGPLSDQEVRAFYERHVYPMMTNQGSLVWKQLTGVGPRLGVTDCPDFWYQTESLGFWLSGYEPQEVLRSGAVIQVVMAERRNGLYGMMLDSASDQGSVFMFVNQSYEPLVRCTAGWRCDTPTSRFDDNLVQY